MAQKKTTQSSLIQVRVDDDLKESADVLFAHLGLDTPTAIRIFLRQSIMNNGIPFEVRLVPNAETIAAMEEAERLTKDAGAKRYKNLAEIVAEVQAEDEDAAV